MGPSHTGKTLLAQRLLEQYHYPYLSIDHLKMGLIRSGQTTLTPEDDEKLTDYLWPIVREMIKTAIENNQNLIIEGSYIPYDYKKDLDGRYLAYISEICLIFSERYIEQNIESILKFENEIEKRLESVYPKEQMLEENRQALFECKKNALHYVQIDKEYKVDWNPDIVFTTKRLRLRRLTKEDSRSLNQILQDEEVMYAYEHAFSDLEVAQWLEKQLKNYEKTGFGLWGVELKETGEMIGQCGLTLQDGEGEQVLEIGYLFQKKHWHQGYATEAARVCKKYAFEELKAEEVFSIIRDTNISSQKVAERNGMTRKKEIVKHYHGLDMPHWMYSISREEFFKEAREIEEDKT